MSNKYPIWILFWFGAIYVIIWIKDQIENKK